MKVSFKRWMESQAIYDKWLRKNLGMDLGDFADLGDMVISNVTMMTPDGGKDGIEYKNGHIFKVFRNPEGTVYKLLDVNDRDPNDPQKADFPHSTSPSKFAGKTFTLTAAQYQNLVMPMGKQQGPMI